MSCPNINSPDWIALVDKHGEDKAWQIFADNNDEIPTIVDKPKVESSFADKQVIPQNSTLQEINKNPFTSSQIIDDLKKTFPDFVINKDGVIKEDGTFVALQPGDKGMSIRNGLHSMVAWANDAYLETPPHEYAHIYVDMYRNAPMVKEAIEKYGEEKLVEKIGRYYTEQYTAPGFKKWVQRFWNMIRKIAGSPNIKYELFKAFRENKILSKDISKGTDIINYQKAPYKRTITSYTEDQNLYDSIEKVYDLANDTSLDKSGNVVKDFILNKSFDNLTKNSRVQKILTNASDVDNYSTNNLNQDINSLKDAYRESVDELKDKDKDSQGNYKNVAGLDADEDLINFTDTLKTNVKDSNDISLYSLFYLSEISTGENSIGVDNFPWQRRFGTISDKKKQYIEKEGIKLANKFIEIKKRTYRATQEKENLILLGNSRIKTQEVLELIKKDIDSTSEKRKNYWFNKGVLGKNKMFNNLIRIVSRLLMTQQGNAKLQSKFLSGYSDSPLQKILYDEFNVARHRSLLVQDKARNYYKEITDVTENIDGSYFYNNDKTISEVETIEIQVNKDNQKIKLTEAEFLSLYLNMRMKKNRIKMIDGAKNATGFVINDVIAERNFISNVGDSQKAMTLTPAQMAEIENIIKNNARFSKSITEIDSALKSMFEELNKTHIAETGMPLPQEEFYFPTRYGVADKNNERRQLRNEDFLGARYSKKGNERAPIRISDAYEIVNTYINSVGNYVGYNIPLQNANKLLNSLRKEYNKDKSRKDYDEITALLKALQGNVNNLTDNSLLYSDGNKKQLVAKFNRLMANFSTSVLSLGVPTMFKQPISYLAAAELIDVEYLNTAGWGKGMIAGINPEEIFQQLHKKKMGEGKSIFPLEWRMDKSNPTYAVILEYSPILKERFLGAISRELGEVLSDTRIAKDIIKVPFGKFIKKALGKKGDLEISKDAMMSGIKAFDIATVTSIWKAVELEAQDKNGPYANKDGTLMLDKSKNKEEYYEHIARRTEEIVNASQPTFDLNNRSSLATSQNPIFRFLTMFGSARSKLAMLLIESVVDYNNNPTKKNAMKLGKRFVNISVLSAAAIVAVDLLKQFTLGSGFDDPEDDVAPFVGYKMLSTITGNFYGLGTMNDYITSNLDDQPWRRQIQLPAEAIAEDVLDVVVNTSKGNFGKATTGIIESSFKIKGAPLYPYVVVKNIVKRTFK